MKKCNFLVLRSPFRKKHLIELIFFTPALKLTFQKFSTFSMLGFFQIFWVIKNFLFMTILLTISLHECLMNRVIIWWKVSKMNHLRIVHVAEKNISQIFPKLYMSGLWELLIQLIRYAVYERRYYPFHLWAIF